MSKRYGRNQKRRAREAIAALQRPIGSQADGIERLMKINAAEHQKKIDLARQITNAKQYMVRNHAMFDPVMLGDVRDLVFHVMKEETLSPFSAMLKPSMSPDSMMEKAFEHIPLDVIVAKLTDYGERTFDSDAIWCEVTVGYQTAGIAISKQAAHNMPPERLAQEIARKLTQQVTDLLTGKVRNYERKY